MTSRIRFYHLLIFILTAFSSYSAWAQPKLLKESVQRGKSIYVQRCIACHQPDGGGVPHMNPPLDGASAVNGKDKFHLIKVIIKGMTNREEIDGEYYSNNMAPHADLSDQQVADVLNYIRNSWSNKAAIVTPKEVKTVRSKFK
ncbi:MAG: c-type cytochrome [Sediminibacterium sp.]